MKTILTVLGIALWIGTFAYPAFSDGHGWGWGHHMMGYWGHSTGMGCGPGACWR